MIVSDKIYILSVVVKSDTSICSKRYKTFDLILFKSYPNKLYYIYNFSVIVLRYNYMLLYVSNTSTHQGIAC